MLTARQLALDESVVRAASSLKVLQTLSWPTAMEHAFVEAWNAGRPVLPTPPAPEPCAVDPVFAEIVRKADPDDPIEAFLARTAAGFETTARMLASVGTPAFATCSIALYGAPGSRPTPGGPTVLEEAEHLLASSASLQVEPEAPTLTAEQARERFQAAIADTLPELRVELDPNLGSLATAGSKRVRLRDGVPWSTVQVDQLVQHEALVHSATKRNGLRQPLGALGLSSPRTTAVQEGLATLAEMITDTLDLQRLRRIALRVRLVNAALEGADFLEVFRMLIDEGHGPSEAYRSTMRIFRGGDVRGGVAFTKDVVYLGGLRQVHQFLLAALRAGRADLPSALFLGRLTTGDAVDLAPCLADGTLLAPETVPPWIARTDRLAAYLAWAAFGQGIAPARLDDFRDAS